MLRARGNKGEVAAIPLTGQPERLTSVIVNGAPMEVERVWMHGKHVIFKFKGVDSITDAERLAGLDVSIPMEQRAAIAEGEYYQSDLVGCEVADETGRPIGTVEGWQETGGPLLVAVRTPSGKELLIPFVNSIFRKIDVAGKRIEVVLPEGLLDLES